MAAKEILTNVGSIIAELEQALIESPTQVPTKFFDNCTKLADLLDQLLMQPKNDLLPFFEMVKQIIIKNMSAYFTKLLKVENLLSKPLRDRFEAIRNKFTSHFKNELNTTVFPTARKSETQTLELFLETREEENNLSFDPLFLTELAEIIENFETIDLNDEANYLEITDLYGKLKKYLEFLMENITETRCYKENNKKLTLNATKDSYEDNDTNNHLIKTIAKETLPLVEEGCIDQGSLIILIKLMPRIHKCLEKIESNQNLRASIAKPAAAILVEEPASAVAKTSHEPVPVLLETIAPHQPEAFKFTLRLSTPGLPYDRKKSDDYVSISKKIASNESFLYRPKEGGREEQFARRLIAKILEDKNYGLGEIVARNKTIIDLLEKAGILDGEHTEQTFQGRYQALYNLAQLFLKGKGASADDEEIQANYQKAILCLALASITPGIDLEKRIETLFEIANIYNQNNNPIECLIYLYYCLEILDDQLPTVASRIRNKAAEILLNTQNLPDKGNASPQQWANRFVCKRESENSLYLAFDLNFKYFGNQSSKEKKAFKTYLCENGGGLAVLTLYLNLHLQNKNAIVLGRLFKKIEEILISTCEILENGDAKSPWHSLKKAIKPGQPISPDLFKFAYQIFIANSSTSPLLNTRALNTPNTPTSRITDLGCCLINCASLSPNFPKDIELEKIYETLITICSKSKLPALLHEAVLYTLRLAIHKKQPTVPTKEVIRHLEKLHALITRNTFRKSDSIRKSLNIQEQIPALQQLIQLWKDLDIDKYGWSEGRFNSLKEFYQSPPYVFPIPAKNSIIEALTKIYDTTNQISKRVSQLVTISTLAPVPDPAPVQTSLQAKPTESKSEKKTHSPLDIKHIASTLGVIFTASRNINCTQFNLKDNEETIATVGNTYVLLHQSIDKIIANDPDVPLNLIERLPLNEEQKTQLYNNKTIVGFWRNDKQNSWQIVFIKTGNNQIQSISFWDPMSANPSMIDVYKQTLIDAIAPNLAKKDIHVESGAQSAITDAEELWSGGDLVFAYALLKLCSENNPAEQIVTDAHPLRDLIKNIVGNFKALCANPSHALTLDLASNIRTLMGIHLSKTTKAVALPTKLASTARRSSKVEELTYSQILEKTKELITEFDNLKIETDSIQNYQRIEEELDYYLELLRTRIDEAVAEHAFTNLSKYPIDTLIKKLYADENLRFFAEQIDVKEFEKNIKELLDLIPALQQRLDATQIIIKTLIPEEQARRKEEDLSSLDIKDKKQKSSPVTQLGEVVFIPPPPPSMPISKTDLRSKKFAAISKQIASNFSGLYANKNGLKVNTLHEIIKRGNNEGLGETGRTPLAQSLINTAGFPENHSETSGTPSGKYKALCKLAGHYINGYYPVDAKERININLGKAVLCLAIASIIPGVTLQEKVDALCQITDIYADPKNRNFNYSEALTYLRFAMDHVDFDAKQTKVRNHELAKKIRAKAAKIFIKKDIRLDKTLKLPGIENPNSWFKSCHIDRQQDLDLYFVLYLYHLSLTPETKIQYETALRQGGGLAVLTLYLQGFVQDEKNKIYDFAINLLADTYRIFNRDKAPNNFPKLTQCWGELFDNVPSDNPAVTSKVKEGRQFFTAVDNLFRELFNLNNEHTTKIITRIEDDIQVEREKRVTKLDLLETPLNRLRDFSFAIIHNCGNASKVTSVEAYHFLENIYRNGEKQEFLHDAIYYSLHVAIFDPNISAKNLVANIKEHLQKISQLQDTQLYNLNRDLKGVPKGETRDRREKATIAPLKTCKERDLAKLEHFWGNLEKVIGDENPVDANNKPLTELIAFYRKPPQSEFMTITYAKDIADLLTSESFLKKLNSKPAAEPEGLDDLDLLGAELAAEQKEREKAKAAASATNLNVAALKPAAAGALEPKEKNPNLEDFLQQWFTFQEIPRDGNCFYNAVVLYLEHKTMRDLRQEVAEHINLNENAYQNVIIPAKGVTLEQHINEIKIGNEWADNSEILALMRILNRPIVAIESDGRIANLQYFYDWEQAKEIFPGDPIFVLYNGINHYDALLLEQPENAKDILERLKKLPINSSQIRPTVSKPAAKPSAKKTAAVSLVPTIPGLKYTSADAHKNCLYGAVAISSKKPINSIRIEVSNDLKFNPRKYTDIAIPNKKDLATHADDIKNGKESQDTAEVDILMARYQRPIVIITENGRIENILSIMDRDDISKCRYPGVPLFVYLKEKNQYDALELDGTQSAHDIFNDLVKLEVNQGQLVIPVNPPTPDHDFEIRGSAIGLAPIATATPALPAKTAAQNSIEPTMQKPAAGATSPTPAIKPAPSVTASAPASLATVALPLTNPQISAVVSAPTPHASGNDNLASAIASQQTQTTTATASLQFVEEPVAMEPVVVKKAAAKSHAKPQTPKKGGTSTDSPSLPVVHSSVIKRSKRQQKPAMQYTQYIGINSSPEHQAEYSRVPVHLTNLIQTEMPPKHSRARLIRIIRGKYKCNMTISAHNIGEHIWINGQMRQCSGFAEINPPFYVAVARDGDETNFKHDPSKFWMKVRSNRTASICKHSIYGILIAASIPALQAILVQVLDCYPVYKAERREIGESRAYDHLKGCTIQNFGLGITEFILLVVATLLIVYEIYIHSIREFQDIANNVLIDCLGNRYVIIQNMLFIIRDPYNVLQGREPEDLTPIGLEIINADSANTGENKALYIDANSTGLRVEFTASAAPSRLVQVQELYNGIVAVRCGDNNEDDINLLKGAAAVAMALRNLFEAIKANPKSENDTTKTAKIDRAIRIGRQYKACLQILANKNDLLDDAKKRDLIAAANKLAAATSTMINGLAAANELVQAAGRTAKNISNLLGAVGSPVITPPPVIVPPPTAPLASETISLLHDTESVAINIPDPNSLDALESVLDQLNNQLRLI